MAIARNEMLLLLANACSMGMSPYSADTTVTLDTQTLGTGAEELPVETEAPPSADNDTGFLPPSDDGASEPPGAPMDDDWDGDGYTESDCNDADPFVNPGEFDFCDGIDNDCDGRLDEDAIWDEDEDFPIYDLGEVYGGDMVEISGLLYPEYDTDIFRFTIHDGLFGWFFIDALLDTVSEHADVSLALVRLREDALGIYEEVIEVDSYGPGGGEFVTYSGQAFHDDSGTYQLIVQTLSGADCEAPYSIIMEFGS